ncbi:TrgA family protein [Salipiger sp. PrR002]|uniref:TrgA family protein n=1 Tax=Salipiger sp. PrR002 TaxID=2706489 RepID=UPI0013BC0E52|nr:TrgA family protein [Salipiger sp. PrR002]NDV99347.1 TrgA family protein [Salipiger sp. PrR002]NDW55833.1 TrgA family protein [Salipiger sp. PrR004]
MTTASRLVGALCLAALAYFASGYLIQILDQKQDFGNFRWVNVALGLVLGWKLLGSRGARGYANGISAGLTSAAALVACGLLLQAGYEMLRLSMRHRYDGAMEAFAAVFQLTLDFGALLLDGGFILLMLAGAIVAGMITEFAARNWR